MADQNKIDEIRALLSEAYSFKSTSKRAQENINAALDLLDSIAAPTGHPLADENGCWGLYAESVLAAAPEATSKQMGGAQVAKAEPVELVGVREQIEEGAGFWHSCSGCHETEDGHPVGRYSYSDTMRCALGNGCSECGGIGAIWDNNDYEEMAKDWDKDAAPTEIAAEGEATERKPLTEAASKELALKRAAWSSKGRRFGVYFLDDSLVSFVRAIEQHHGITGGGK